MLIESYCNLHLKITQQYFIYYLASIRTWINEFLHTGDTLKKDLQKCALWTVGVYSESIRQDASTRKYYKRRSRFVISRIISLVEAE